MSGALDGLIVADFSRVLAGPYATMLLGDLGATVIKVERPGSGDDTRSWRPPVDSHGVATYFQSVNRNKYSVAWDLDISEDRQRAMRLAHKADVVIENFPSGALDRRGLGYDDVTAANPRVIYCSISGFGGASDLPGYDLIVQAMGGLMDITGDAGPTKVGVAIVDVVTGLHAAIGILAALHHRDQTGEGQRIDVTLLGSLLSALVNQSAAAVITGESPHRMGNAHPSICPYEPYPTADRSIVIAVGNDQQFARLCHVLGHAEWADDPRFATNTARVEHREQLSALISGILCGRGANEWRSLLEAERIPCGPINTVTEAIVAANKLGLEPIVEIEGNKQVANPLSFSRTPATYRLRPPVLDEHSRLIEDLLA